MSQLFLVLKAITVENPYQPPATTPLRSEREARSPSWIRGLAWAVPMFAVGAAIPFLIPATYFAVAAFNGTEADPELFDSAMIWPSVGCGILFSLGAIRNFSPPQPEGFVTCLARIGITGFVWGYFAIWADFLFGIIPVNQTFDTDPWLPLRALILVSVPACYTFWYTNKRMVNQTPSLQQTNPA